MSLNNIAQKTLLISGCSYGVCFSNIEDSLKKLFEVDHVVNLSEGGASLDRCIRVVIEWIAQNHTPYMVILPVTHSHRFDLPISKKNHPLHNIHYKCCWHGTRINEEIYEKSINPLIPFESLRDFFKHGVMVHQIEHPSQDYNFVKLLTFQAFLQINGIHHLIYDSGNYYQKVWMKHISVDLENNSGYQPGMKKRDLIKNCKGIFNFFDFCANAWMYDTMQESQKKELFDFLNKNKIKYPLLDNENDNCIKASIHHSPEDTLRLMQFLKEQNAVFLR